jgi:hypothetical protein
MRAALSTIALFLSSTAFAQQGELQVLREGGSNISPHEVTPLREVTLDPSGLYAFSGLNFNLSDGSVFEPVSIPLGASYGLVPNLEVGGDLSIVINRPAPFSSLAVGSPRLFGRYAILPRILAIEASIFIPVGKDGDRLGFRFEAPFRYAVTPEFLVMGALTWAPYLGSETYTFVDFTQVGVTGIYRFIPNFWAALEVGLTLVKFDTANVPIGIAVGYEIVPGIAILPGFRFPDIGTPSARVFQILAVYTLNFEGARTPESQEPAVSE